MIFLSCSNRSSYREIQYLGLSRWDGAAYIMFTNCFYNGQNGYYIKSFIEGSFYYKNSTMRYKNDII
jgi:hypothetical protein